LKIVSLGQLERIYWEKFQSGDNKAFTELYNNHLEVLFAYGMKLCSNKEVVQDSIQDVFIEIYKQRKRLSRPNNLRYYLIRSVKHEIFKKLKSERKFTDSEESTASTFSTEYGIESKIIDKEISNDKIRLMSKALIDLSDKQQEILYLRFTLELSYLEVSKMVNIDHNSVRKQVYRILKKLRKGEIVKNYKDLLFFLSFIKK